MTVLEKSRTAGWTSKVRKAFIAMLAMILSLVSPAQTAVFADFTLPYRSIGVTFYLQADLALTGGFSDAHQSLRHIVFRQMYCGFMKTHFTKARHMILWECIHLKTRSV